MKEFSSWREFEQYVYQFNREHNNHYNHINRPLKANIIFSNDTRDWNRHDYTEEERTYKITNGDKWWYEECGGRSIFAYCPAEPGVLRLDYYLATWKIEKIRVTQE